jgi:hypothetical protein
MTAVKKFYTLLIDPDSGYTSFGKCLIIVWSREFLQFETDALFFFLCLDNIVESAMDDPKFVKMYPIITNQNLLEELIRFIELPPKKIKGIGIDNGEIFKKENGRQISGSHRYWGVLEEDGTYNIYKKFKGGPLDGKNLSFFRLLVSHSIYFSLYFLGKIWLILRIQDESNRTTEFRQRDDRSPAPLYVAKVPTFKSSFFAYDNLSRGKTCG